LENVIDQHRAGGGMTVLATHGDVQVAGARILEFTG
jgi:ABC-type transport system involved in cytochrome c biogenesis ATPase subunit